MVSCKLYGRTANQCFQIAAGLSYSLDYGVPFVLPDTTLNEKIWPNYFRGKFASATGRERFLRGHYKEPFHHYLKIPEFSDGVILDGYFQSFRYFCEHIREIRNAFEFNRKTVNRTISIHVRRGDYLNFPTKHPVVTIEYLTQAIDQFDKGKYRFFVFSDDVQWIKDCFLPILKGCFVTVVEQGDPIEDMRFMASCQHNIVCNSSFSVFSAIMNINTDKRVICPDETSYFGSGNSHLNTKDVMPPDWHRIKF